MKTLRSYFTGSLLFFGFALICGYWLDGMRGVSIVAILSVLETSLSLDNAVVNAKILENWDPWWRRAFLVFGLPIAVFGMRLIFPILIVSVTTWLGNIEVLRMAIDSPDAYSAALTAVHHEVGAFGGTFLMMVFLNFFIDINKTHHWLRWIERPLTRLWQIEAVEVALTILLLLFSATFFEAVEKYEFIMAGIWGIITYIFSKWFSSLLWQQGSKATEHIVKQWIGGFLYLEILDASFSFDGVIGAFALSNNLFVIALGLSVGAFFVRSMTIYLVDKGTLANIRYLEHGAFWAIGALACIMLFGVKLHIPEVVTGFIGALLIALATWQSISLNKKERLQPKV